MINIDYKYKYLKYKNKLFKFQQGGNIMIQYRNDFGANINLRKKYIDVNDINDIGNTPLMNIIFNKLDIVDLDKYKDTCYINYKNIYTGDTALHIALYCYDKNKKYYYNIIIFLLNNGCDPRIKNNANQSIADLNLILPRMIGQLIYNRIDELNHYDEYDGKGFTKLMHSVNLNDVRTVIDMLNNGVNPNFQNPYDGKTALHYAIDNNFDDMIQLLLIYSNPFICDYFEKDDLFLLKNNKISNAFGKNCISYIKIKMYQIEYLS